MSRQSDLTVRRDAHRGGVESAKSDAGFVERRNSRKNSRAERGGGGRSERSASEDRAERRALIGVDRDPDAVVVGAPREDR
jgi:hypothetical protein